MPRYAQKEKPNSQHVDGSLLAAQDAARQPSHVPATAVTDDVLAAIDEALEGVEENLAVTYRQLGGE